MFRPSVRRKPRDLFHEAKWCILAHIIVQKVRIKWTLFFYGLLLSVAIFRVILLDLLPKRFHIALSRLESYASTTETWEYCWLGSAFVMTLSAWATLNNHTSSLPLVIYGNAVFGLLPICYGMWDNSHKFMAYLLQKDFLGLSFIFEYFNLYGRLLIERGNTPILGSSFTILQYYWISLAVQVHLFHILFVYQLCKIFKSVNAKKTM